MRRAVRRRKRRDSMLPGFWKVGARAAVNAGVTCLLAAWGAGPRVAREEGRSERQIKIEAPEAAPVKN